ncbi:putative transposase [Bacilli bacterium PM5-3]|nr:putative transposase [Bacilli bacterium PM5-3]MDH6603485.1 putative transposase [Bacilli bacterium PM5-9]
MLKVLKLSKSGYYDFLKRKPSPMKLRKENITQLVREIHNDSKQIYGAPKITAILQQNGETLSEKYVGNIMRENKLKAHYIKPKTITTKDCDFASELKNILNRDFNPTKPNSAWCTDITYIWTIEDGFVYLSSVMDLFSRKIIAWTLSRTMEVSEVMKCIEQAKERREYDEALIIHSDRGAQYTSKKYKEILEGITTSYSRKGNCWDNACIESFHGLIKREWLNRIKKIEDYNHAKQDYMQRSDYLMFSIRHMDCSISNMVCS